MSGSVQVKAKRSGESGYKGIVKKASLRSRTANWVVEEGMREKSIGIWNYWVYGENSYVDKSQVLDQVIGDIWFLTGRIGVL